MRFEIALRTSCPVTTQNPSCRVLQATGHCSRSSCACAGYVSRYSGECWSNSTTTRSSVAIGNPRCSAGQWAYVIGAACNSHHRRGADRWTRLTQCLPRCSTSHRRSTRSHSATRASSRATTSTPRSPACRAESPIHRTQDLGEPAGPDFWSITRYDDVRTRVARSPTYTNAPNIVIEDYQRSGNSILHLDPPEHTQLRLIVNKGFTPRMVERMADEVRSRARRVARPLVRRVEAFDLVDAFAALACRCR